VSDTLNGKLVWPPRGDVTEGSGFYSMFVAEGEAQTLQQLNLAAFETMANSNHRFGAFEETVKHTIYVYIYICLYIYIYILVFFFVLVPVSFFWSFESMANSKQRFGAFEETVKQSMLVFFFVCMASR
jgi:hypothetical protein